MYPQKYISQQGADLFIPECNKFHENGDIVTIRSIFTKQKFNLFLSHPIAKQNQTNEQDK